MLFDLLFFALPLMLALCLGAHAVRDEAPKFWQPTFALLAYCIFYLIGGREVILYMFGALLGHGYIFFL
jgi:hypothetical protein